MNWKKTKDAIGTFLAIAFVCSPLWVAVLFSVYTPKPQPRICAETTTKYYWKSWAGSSYYAGETLEEARLMAGKNPITKSDECVRWENVP